MPGSEYYDNEYASRRIDGDCENKDEEVITNPNRILMNEIERNLLETYKLGTTVSNRINEKKHEIGSLESNLKKIHRKYKCLNDLKQVLEKE